jgi:exodeoxyribonuclease VII large subunit
MQAELFTSDQSESKIWEISEINASIRKLLEQNLSHIWLRGEISNLKSYSSGHFYFQLKDEISQLKGVLFKGDARNQATPPVEGSSYLIFGDITVYEPRGDYQIRVKHLLEEGRGNLRLEFERLKKSLSDEGLFDSEKKKPIPKYTKRIGLITSKEGAAIEDFTSILQRRGWKGEIILSPSLVQGATAPQNLINAINQMNRLEIPVDVLILTRGGGSIEDLWAFNDEELVRKVAGCTVPVISAIGHQTDFVLTDFVSDLRAETPSAAAELLSSGFLEQSQKLDLLSSNLHEIAIRTVEKASDHLGLLSLRLKSLNPSHRIEMANQSLTDLSARLAISISRFLEQKKSALSHIETRLDGVNIEKILKKGFAIIKDPSGKAISSIKSLQEQEEIGILLQDGEIQFLVQPKK